MTKGRDLSRPFVIVLDQLQPLVLPQPSQT